MYSVEDTQVARNVELNDGSRMPLLGLGTWKVAPFLYLHLTLRSCSVLLFSHVLLRVTICLLMLSNTCI